MATILAGLIVLSVPLLWWLRRKENDEYSRQLEEIKALVDERSQLVDSLHTRFDKLDEKTEDTRDQSNRFIYLHAASVLGSMSRWNVSPFRYLRNDLVQAYLSGLPSSVSQDWWQEMQKQRMRVPTSAGSWATQRATRSLTGTQGSYQGVDPKRFARRATRLQTPRAAREPHQPYEQFVKLPHAHSG